MVRESTIRAWHRLRRTVDTALAQICERPEASPLWHQDRPYRRHVLQRFPYVVFYRLLADDSIEITAIAHAKQRPGYWLTRRR